MSDTGTIYTRHPDSAPWEINAQIIPYLQQARLYDFHLIAYERVDQALVTALVERWRQETHTFHLPLGEATVTLLDVAMLTQLPIEGHVVCTVGRQRESWQDMVHRVLGVRPPAKVASGIRVHQVKTTLTIFITITYAYLSFINYISRVVSMGPLPR